jgi:hypothetical protein
MIRLTFVNGELGSNDTYILTVGVCGRALAVLATATARRIIKCVDSSTYLVTRVEEGNMRLSDSPLGGVVAFAGGIAFAGEPMTRQWLPRDVALSLQAAALKGSFGLAWWCVDCTNM